MQEIKYLVRSMLTFKSKNILTQISDIDVKISNHQELIPEMTISTSAVRYQDGNPPQLIVMSMLSGACL